MKLLSLNIWGGKIFSSLIDYLKEQQDKIDIFCLQEVLSVDGRVTRNPNFKVNLWQELISFFPNFNHFFDSTFSGVTPEGKRAKHLKAGLGIFIKKSISIKSHGEIFLYRNKLSIVNYKLTNMPVNLQFVNIKINNKPVLIFNFKGIWYPGDKLDTPLRLKQSQKLLQFLKKYKSPKILCGDFNLLPNTKSIAIIEGQMQNLIKDYHIKTTRSTLNHYKGSHKQKFADYMFVSKEVKVIDFKVPDIAVSDHLPLILEFEV